MEVERITSGLRHGTRPPARQMPPVKVTKSISVADVFKQKPFKAKDGSVNTKRVVNSSKAAVGHAADNKAPQFKSRSSSRSPKKTSSRVSKKADLHPLAVTFKKSNDDYRRHLYQSTTLKINTTLESLLLHLYENSLQVMSLDPTNNSDAPRTRLSVPDKYERKALKLYQPISAYKVGLTRTNTDGTRMQLMSTLESRMVDYEEYIAKHKAELEKLKDDWEAVVGEIWKVGVQCLGEELMESMLFTSKDVLDVLSPTTTAESTLFMAEQGTSPRPRTVRNKKRVTFDTPGSTGADLLETGKGALKFLYQPTRVRLAPVPAVPPMPKHEASNLMTQVRELGQKELEEFRKAEREYKVYWQKKNRRLAQVLVED